MANKNYSLQNIQTFKSDIENVLNFCVQKNLKLDRALVFDFRVNLNKIEESEEIIRKDFKADDEAYAEFIKERFSLIEKHGAEINQHPNGSVEISNMKEVNKKEEFQKDLKKLAEQYKEAIQRQNLIVQENNKLAMEKIASIEWKKIPLDKFPEEILANQFPTSFVEFVQDEAVSV